ncbi:MAG: single-stranded DNA-binding protein [Clostridia bacterium]|nr:single-stranded DNA-binding protein [Clostridia bacterium]
MANLNLNKVILAGRLTADPELRTTPQGTQVVRFTVAITRRRAAQGAEPQADFINCVAWRQQAEFVSKFFKKGSSICVIGSIMTGSYTAQDGSKRYTTEVQADEINFVESKSESENRSTGAGNYVPDSYGTPSFSNGNGSAPRFEDVQNDDDLPF